MWRPLPFARCNCLMSEAEDDECTLFERMERLQGSYIGTATQDGGSLPDYDFARLRTELLSNPQTRTHITDVVRKYRDQPQFWQFIKNKFPSYRERREYVWAQFAPLLEYLEIQDRSPGVMPISATLEAFDPNNVHPAWQKALDRRSHDPEGAITAARMLLETVCKHILDADEAATYPDDADLPKLWALTAETLNLAPHQHQEAVFKGILGNCQSIVNYLGLSETRSVTRMGRGENL